MRNISAYFISFITGAVLYSFIEILWRGHTHWTMGIAGGICLTAIYVLRLACPDISLILRCITGAFIILTVEFAVGFIVNIMLDWSVWDYSDRRFNIYGQICPLYAFLWALICIPGNIVSAGIQMFVRDKVLNNKTLRRIDE